MSSGPILIIAPTQSGKTAFAGALAQRIGRDCAIREEPWYDSTTTALLVKAAEAPDGPPWIETAQNARDVPRRIRDAARAIFERRAPGEFIWRNVKPGARPLVIEVRQSGAPAFDLKDMLTTILHAAYGTADTSPGKETYSLVLLEGRWSDLGAADDPKHADGAPVASGGEPAAAKATSADAPNGPQSRGTAPTRCEVSSCTVCTRIRT